ncbi:Golgi phosphoprotein 3 (GPP34) [Streptomyces sp. Ag82_O1-12]|uniref:GOLPH3/VPS74 family protein n=1 Tax=unclassified Streptomyces TaxID=2593676 RepID=UPI000BD78066|nr:MULTISPECIES: GPP34 family phosphoprotein [unclassified Streptomyces]SMQ16429.1 Golgi phosphoprotein 3 (GPP34) [Streptomyces sp. Ag82_O1-12]SOD45458.1 Golgi phosphoprotein 3 (GPP34) [Streptomyces sp. Ag82_G6-1]
MHTPTQPPAETPTTLGEQLMLLSLDDESGAAKESAKVAPAISGALLVELALAGRIGVTDDRVTVLDATPLGDPALDTALADIAGRDKPGSAKDWITRLKTDAMAWANRGLIEKGLVREEKKKVLGLFSVRRYPETDGSVEAAVRQRLDAVVLRGAAPDERTASLVALLHGAKLHRLAFPDADAREVRAAMESISHGQWSATAVRHVVRAAEEALAVIVAVTVTTNVIAGG